jgi:predicted AAA+ superfamily ATPase
MATVPRFFEAPERSFFLFGPRGTGKSTLLAETLPDAVVVDLLEPETYRMLVALFRLPDYSELAANGRTGA